MKEPTLYIKFKECCYTCPHRRTDMSEDRMIIVSGGPIQTVTHIRCEHDQVCFLFLNEEEQK
jgi:hypothetical protein